DSANSHGPEYEPRCRSGSCLPNAQSKPRHDATTHHRPPRTRAQYSPSTGRRVWVFRPSYNGPTATRPISCYFTVTEGSKNPRKPPFFAGFSVRLGGGPKTLTQKTKNPLVAVSIPPGPSQPRGGGDGGPHPYRTRSLFSPAFLGGPEPERIPGRTRDAPFPLP